MSQGLHETASGTADTCGTFSSCYLQRRHDGVHQLSLQVGSVSELSLIVVQCVVQVGDRSVCSKSTHHIVLMAFTYTDFPLILIPN